MREQAIKAMAGNSYPHALKVAEMHLDRLLDYLTEYDGDWRNLARIAFMEDYYGRERSVKDLIEALR